MPSFGGRRRVVNHFLKIIAALTAALLIAVPLPNKDAGADVIYRTLTSPNFIFRCTGRDARAAAALKEYAEEIRKKVLADIGSTFAGKTLVIISPSVEQFQKDQPEGMWLPLWAAGVAYPAKNLIILRSQRSIKRGRIDLKEIFVHEFTHIALGRALKNESVPAWLSEGLAMYESREWSLARHAVLTRAVLTGQLIPLRTLTQNFPTDESKAELAYAESFIFVSYIINKIGTDAFHKFIYHYSGSGDLVGSLKAATGMSLLDLEDKWLNYLKLRTSWIPLIVSGTTLWFLASVIFIYGYFRKRNIARIKLRQWEEMERRQAAKDSGPPYLH